MLGVALVSDSYEIMFCIRIFSSFIFLRPASSKSLLTALSNYISEWCESACDLMNRSSMGSEKSFIGTAL